ncbi:MAG: V-type ATP synthase subunit K [Firmicutes bacterium]|nr:V-type ATP synthase subunit K [Bacillota bacterium]
MELGTLYAFLGVAIAVLLSGIGSAYGVSIAGRVSAGVVTEDPKKFGQTLVLTALPGTQGIYGFVIGMLMVFKFAAVGGPIPLEAGVRFLIAGMPVGVVGLVSAILQGQVAASGIGIVAKRPEESAKGIVYAGLVETYAILAFIISFFLFNTITL